MNFLRNVFRKLFLVMEIVSKEGVVHFRRYRILSLPFFNIYIHHILKSDQDRHMHDHPWNFRSFLLKGSYREEVRYPPRFLVLHSYWHQAGDVIKHDRRDVHHIDLVTPSVWSLVITTGKEHDWGYHTSQGWIQHEEYRNLKREGKLPL